MKERQYYVYILASGRNGTLYVGVTNDIIRRVQEHEEGKVPGFTEKYGVTRLAYYDVTDSIAEAIGAEKRIKKWNRAWKLRLIEEQNPDWVDLFEGLAE